MAERSSAPVATARWQGQPLVFLSTVIIVWIAARVIHHWPDESLATVLPRPGAVVARTGDEPSGHDDMAAEMDRLQPPMRLLGVARQPASSSPASMSPAGFWTSGKTPDGSRPVEKSEQRTVQAAAGQLPRTLQEAILPPPPPGQGMREGGGRWSVYGWVLVRQGDASGSLAPGGQYGGSQAGLVVQWTLADTRNRPALYARAISALARGDDRNLALGLSARPIAGLPIDLAVERRFALAEGQRDRLALLAVAGGGKVLQQTGTRIEAYGQAGIVGIGKPQAFFDLQATAMQPLHRRDARAFALGGGLWAGGQQNPDGQGGKPWLHRVDIGPRAALTFPVERGALTLALDWRERIDGDARPASGVALTLSASF